MPIDPRRGESVEEVRLKSLRFRSLDSSFKECCRLRGGERAWKMPIRKSSSTYSMLALSRSQGLPKSQQPTCCRKVERAK